MENYSDRIILINKHHKDILPSDAYIQYIGRGSIFGNPFTHLELDKTKAEFHVKDRQEAIHKYLDYSLEQFKTNKEYQKLLVGLARMVFNGSTIYLQCYCVPNLCHGTIIKQFLIKIIQTIKQSLDEK
jgi:hypothetical protein